MATALMEATRLDFRRSRWEYFSPVQPLDLLTMLNLAAPEWNTVVRTLAALLDPENYRIVKALVNGDNKDLLESLNLLLKYFRLLEMEHTIDLAIRVVFRVSLYSSAMKFAQQGFENPYTPDEFSRGMQTLSERFEDELRLRLFFTLSPNRMGYYRKSDLFGESVAEKFPGASLDIEEAGNCYALDRLADCCAFAKLAPQTNTRSSAKYRGNEEDRRVVSALKTGTMLSCEEFSLPRDSMHRPRF